MSLECEEGVARGDGQSLGVQEALAQEVTAGRVTSKSLRVPGRLGAKHCMDNDLRSLSLESSHRGGSWDLQPGSGLCGAPWLRRQCAEPRAASRRELGEAGSQAQVQGGQQEWARGRQGKQSKVGVAVACTPGALGS